MVSKRKKFVPAPRLVCVEENPGPHFSTHLEEEERWKIIFIMKEQKKEKFNVSEIARKVKTSRPTVYETSQRYEETGTVHDREHTDRKRKLSKSEVKKAVRSAKKKNAHQRLHAN